MVISQIPALKAHISFLVWELNIWQTRSWQIYRESNGYFTRFLLWQLKALHLADPLSNGDFTDSCEIHISFLLWELHIWQTRSWQIYPPIQWQFHRFLLWQLTFHDSSWFQLTTLQSSSFGRPSGLGRSNQPHIKWQFHRFLWNSYFIPTLTDQHLAVPSFGRCSPHQMANSQIPALLSKLIFGRPLVKWWFHRFLWNSWFQLPTLRAQHLADQV